MTRALRRLERIGYVELERGAVYDARRLYALPTGAGRRAADAARDFERAVDDQLVRGMADLVKGGLYSGLLHMVYAEPAETTSAVSPQA